MAYYMVLNDGETYTNVDQCAVVWVTDNMPDENLDEVIKSRVEAGIVTALLFEGENGDGFSIRQLTNGTEVTFR